MGADSYLEKSPSAGRMGKAAEYLIAAHCILATRGELSVSVSIVDDEGVDLVFHRRGGTSTLAVQVKSRMSDSAVVQRQSFFAPVRAATFGPRADLDLLFAAIDIDLGVVRQAWLVPSVEFGRRKGDAPDSGRYRFSASMKPGSSDQWSPFRVSAQELPQKILSRLRELDGDSGEVLRPVP